MKFLTIAEIDGKFDSEWVLIEDPSTDESLEVSGGTVRCHGRDRDEVYRRAVQIRPKRFAIVYTARCRGIRRSRFDLFIRSAAGLDRRAGGTQRTEWKRRPATGFRHGATATLINVAMLVAIGYDPALSKDRVQGTTGSGVEFAPRVELRRLPALGQERYGLQMLGHTLPPSSGVDGLPGLDFFSWLASVRRFFAPVSCALIKRDSR